MPQFLGSFFKKRSGSDPDASQEISPIKELLTLFGVFILLVFCFSMAHLPGGDDWATFYGATQRVLQNQQLYGTKINASGASTGFTCYFMKIMELLEKD